MKTIKLFSNKLGVSPLIATVLLIAFAVALGAVVMSWGQKYVVDNQERVEETSKHAMTCQEVNLNILEIGGIPKVCYTKKNSTVELYSMVENLGAIEVESILVKAVGEFDEVNSTEVDVKIGVTDAKKVILNYNSSFGSIKQVTYTPKIKMEGSRTTGPCIKQMLVVENLYPC